ncbi:MULTISPECIES: hypothetical protein [Variovorax]|jgi:hypothetical protein|uniref:hypothetical protein n=1 Tax=Variovorax TaxID=34072 RepID=UPI0008997ABA|nr:MULTISPECIES: hypothetical protein [unclassified Variovorax]SDZ36086.1 hypothetical protein SAMN05518854_105262 [Variovorax sp. YR266]SES77988.1 hypothetical protein SAMN05443580_101264 [Variovorax sp. OV084]SOD27514.1 hypothetical protein SAMN05518800_3073 [Variovorax sp. YR752]
MRFRIATLCIAAVPALVLTSLAHAGGLADPDYPQISHSTQSRDAVAEDAMRANNGIHATEVLESQVQAPVSGADRAQVQAEAIRANTGIHPTEVLESQVQPPVASANQPDAAMTHATNTTGATTY